MFTKIKRKKVQVTKIKNEVECITFDLKAIKMILRKHYEYFYVEILYLKLMFQIKEQYETDILRKAQTLNLTEIEFKILDQ